MQHEKVITRAKIVRTKLDTEKGIVAEVYVKFDFNWIQHNENDQTFVTPEEILSAKLELWNKIKPV